jgi:hypothetical protein
VGWTLQGLDMGLSGGHFFPPELWKLIEQFEALNRVEEVRQSLPHALALNWPAPAKMPVHGADDEGSMTAPAVGRRRRVTSNSAQGGSQKCVAMCLCLRVLRAGLCGGRQGVALSHIILG